MTMFMKDSKHFNINDIDINKIRVLKAKSFMKEKRSYKCYIFYEHDDKYILLNFCFSKILAGYYNEYTNEDKKCIGDVSKTMNFVINDDDLVYKINDIFEYIESKLELLCKNVFIKEEWIVI